MSKIASPPDPRRGPAKTRIRKNVPFLESDFFDWQLVNELNAEDISEKEDVEAMSKILSAFLLCKFNKDDFAIVQVPIVFQLLQLLQVSLAYQMNSQTLLENENKELENEVSYLREKGERVRNKLAHAIEEMKKWKHAHRCPVCNAAFPSSEIVDAHVKKFHAHVFNAWTCVKNNEPDKSNVDTEALLKEVVNLRRQVLEQNKTFLPVRQKPCTYQELTLDTLEERIREERFKRKKEGSDREGAPIRMKLSQPCPVVDVKPLVDINDDIEIPAYLQKKVDKFLNPQTRSKRNTESIDQVSERIARMLKSNPEAVMKESAVIRKRFADQIKEDHALPSYDIKLRLRIGGEAYYQAQCHQSLTSLMGAVNVDSFSDAEYSMMTDPEDEKAMSSSKARPSKKKDKDKSEKNEKGESKDTKTQLEEADKSSASVPNLENKDETKDENTQEQEKSKSKEEAQAAQDADNGVVRLFAPRPKKPIEPPPNPMTKVVDKLKEEPKVEPKVEEPAEEKDPGNCSMVSLGPESPPEDPNQPRLLVDRAKTKKFGRQAAQFQSSSEFASSSESSGLRPVVDSASDTLPGQTKPKPKPTSMVEVNTSDELSQPKPKTKPQLDDFDAPPKPKPKPKKPQTNDFDDFDAPPKPKPKPKKSQANDFDDFDAPPKPKPKKPQTNDFDAPPKPKPKKPPANDFDDWDDPLPGPSRPKPTKKKTGFSKGTTSLARTRRNANPFDEPD